MDNLVSINFNDSEIKRICHEKISAMFKEAESELVFWDSAELKRRTCMSWSTIQKTFFYDERFVKRKVGRDWYFPAREARDFLETWLKEQMPY